MRQAFFAIVNPAAGGGQCGRLADGALDKIRQHGIEVQVAKTQFPGQGIELARSAYRDGFRKFLAVGGDGTSYEIINGVFPEADSGEPPTLALLPLGTGNSFLRDFSDQGANHAMNALLEGRSRRCDVIRLIHERGTIYYINLLSIGFTADVATITNRKFKSLGEFGYLLGVLICLIRLRRRSFPLRTDNRKEFDNRRCLFLTFNNSKFTGGKMMIAPQADPTDGMVEFVRWGPIGRLGLLWNLHRLYDGSHVNHPLASRQAVREVEFQLDSPVDVMVDGEVSALQCQKLEVLPGAINVLV